MEGKRGVIEVQFNWMFILIAGALILIFFVGLVQKQEKVSGEKRDVGIKSRLNTILVSAKQSTGTLFVIGIPKTEITFSCNGYSVGGTAPFQLGMSFSPSRIKSATNTIFLQALDWSLPYKVANVQYIFTPDTRYVITSDSAEIDDLSEILPQNMTKSVEDPSTIIDNNHYRIRLISIEKDGSGGTRPSDPDFPELPDFVKRMKNEDVTAIHIVILKDGSENAFDGYGIVEFYTKEDDNRFSSSPSEFSYIKKETLLGAIFSDTNDTYSCVMQRALKQFNVTSNIYKARTERLYGLYREDNSDPANNGPYAGHCDSSIQYFFASDKIQQMIDAVGEENNAEALYEKSYTEDNSIHAINRNLQIDSCPLLY